MQIIAIVSLVITIVFTLLALVAFRNDDTVPVGVVSSFVAVVMVIITVVAGWLAVAPEYRLHRAEVEKRILVEEAKAEADAAVELARGEIERAKGTAEANRIVSDSITEPYLRYLYINNLAKTDNQIIYLPTEAGLPVLEADRLNQ